uniref:polynucleotide adenylyltransferase n=1 Tax=Albugo laibachii Nc14 TaxID=890382 RepID=F0WY48_9STRA|nr:Poly(A) polymerase putative [Albugo laibachii Nc14]|eukprot:CCA26398.1 Poly(A) polymerase putative [Albugo laibachii Nc14]
MSDITRVTPYGSVSWSTIARGPSAIPHEATKATKATKASEITTVVRKPEETPCKLRRNHASSFLSNCSTLHSSNSSQWEASSVSSASSTSLEEHDHALELSPVSPVSSNGTQDAYNKIVCTNATIQTVSSPSLLPANVPTVPIRTKVSQPPYLHPVVQPLYLGPTSDFDVQNTHSLLRYFHSIAKLPRSSDLSHRHLAIEELQRVVDLWLVQKFPEYPDSKIALFLGGSWHLKAGFSDSDLDIVAFAPNFVTLDCFLTDLYVYLSNLPNSKITKLVAMKKATVPILAFKLNGVHIDFLLARSTELKVPTHLPICCDEILSGMDSISIRSMSIARVSSLVLELVPKGCAFRSFVRIIRLWAKRRGIYSNKTGFLGGISWTLLAVFICQMLPEASLSVLLHRFFLVFSKWTWPTPVWIARPYLGNAEADGVQWCPQTNHHDRAHLMPIITPGYPSVNSAVNVNRATLRIMQEEFQRGRYIVEEITEKYAFGNWQNLFTPSEFLVRYDNYLVMRVQALNEEDLDQWSNYIASRLRKLVESLEVAIPIRSVHPYPVLMPGTQDPGVNASGYYLLGFEVENRKRGCKSNTLCEEAKACTVSAMRYFIATEVDQCTERKPGMKIDLQYANWNALPLCVLPYNDRVQAAGERARYILQRAHKNHVLSYRRE